MPSKEAPGQRARVPQPGIVGQQAMEWGIVNRVVDDDQVLTTALEIAGTMTQGPTQAFGATKRIILSGATESLVAQLEKESRAMTAMAGKADGQEEIAAFLGKRTPKFTGR